jgi:hypothetical protein
MRSLRFRERKAIRSLWYCSGSAALRSVGNRRLVLALVLLAAVAGCDAIGLSSWNWNQRLALEVETPEGVKTGGSVIAVKATRGWKWLPGEGRGGIGTRVKGEAAVVEIAPGKYLFALIDGDDEAELAFTLFFPDPAPSTFERARQLETLRVARAVPRDRYPLLAIFDDIADPRTVRRVDPDNLAATFGPGVSLRRITLEITDEKVTKGKIKSLLPWLDWSREQFLAFGNGETPLRIPREAISRISFKRH